MKKGANVRKAVLVLLCLVVLVVVLAGTGWVLKYRLIALRLGISQPVYGKMISEEQVMVPMRDGVQLATDIFKPDAKGPFPVILVRLPYGKDGARSITLGGMTFSPTIFFTQRGYALVTQDTRGRFGSEGDFYAFRDERQDGEDMVKWLEDQPWFDGSLGTFGGSYFGYTQWALAPFCQDTLKCMSPMIITSDLHGSMFRGGAFSYMSTGGWAMGVGEHEDGDRGKPDFEEGMWHLPLIDADDACIGDVDFYNDWLTHYRRDEYWEAINLDDDIPQITAPALLMTGWFDLFIGDQVEDFVRMRQSHAGQASQSRLVVGPWGHAELVGDIEFGEDASLMSLIPEIFRWNDYWLRELGALPEKPVKIFVMGINRWREETTWPLEGTQYKPFYFHSAGDACTAQGGGTLDEVVSGQDEPSDGYSYDPADPCPTRGGSYLGPGCGPRDQADVESREDVLVYTSEPLQEPLEVTGPITCILYASSSCDDTDFTVKLCDVHPDGRSINLQEGILRARFRTPGKEEPLVPGEIYKLEIDVWATSNVFLEGHRIRVQISSSNFPEFDRNLNIFGPYAQGTEMAVARQTIYHDADHPSHILLPIIPAGR